MANAHSSQAADFGYDVPRNKRMLRYDINKVSRGRGVCSLDFRGEVQNVVPAPIWNSLGETVQKAWAEITARASLLFVEPILKIGEKASIMPDLPSGGRVTPHRPGTALA